MAEVVFLSGVPDKLGYAGRLLRKKWREGARVAVFGSPDLLQRLDQALWTGNALEFLPHRRWAAGQTLPAGMARTPIWLLEQTQPGLAGRLGCDSAVNLGLDEVDGLLQFGRVAEIVGDAPADRAAGRQRWKRYGALGQTPDHRPQGPR